MLGINNANWRVKRPAGGSKGPTRGSGGQPEGLEGQPGGLEGQAGERGYKKTINIDSDLPC